MTKLMHPPNNQNSQSKRGHERNPLSGKNTADRKPPIVSRGVLIDGVWWIAGGMGAAGVLVSKDRLLVAPIVGGIIFLVIMSISAVSGLLARRRWHKTSKRLR